ncbi:Glycosyl transferase family 31 [Trinorchestia longiramus]|nr:Glycosyl transferase family 31 [Trinorchestia longiramus]
MFPWRRFDKIDDRYSSLPLDRLKNYHLETAKENILTRVPTPIKFLIKESDTCGKFASNSVDGQRLHLSINEGNVAEKRQGVVAVAVVSSAVRNFRERQNVRSSWGDPSVTHRTGIPVVFIVGTTTSVRGQQSLVRESLAFRDIVQAEFIDTYNNLSVKSLAGLSWAAQYCPIAPWVLKTDDDMSVNVFALAELLQTHQENIHRINSASPPLQTGEQTSSEIGDTCKQGRCLLCDKVSEHAKALDSQTYEFGVSAKEWQQKTYPPYCHGVGYLVPTQAVSALLAAAQVTNYVRVEDVFVTGILASAARLRIQRMRPPALWHDAFHARRRVNLFLEGNRLTLELDRDLEGGKWTGPALWHALLQRYNASSSQGKM